MDLAEQENKIIRKLKKERENQRLSQLELAYRAGISQNMIAYIETGKRTPTLLTLLKLCNALTINPATLFDNEENQKEAIRTQIIDLIKLL